jgi:integrase
MRGHLVKRAQGSWTIVLSLGRDERGKPRQKWVTIRGTRKDAERELSRLLHAMDTGAYVEPGRASLGEYLGKWLGAVRPSVAAKTFERYAEIVRCHLLPSLGAVPLAKLSPLHMQTYYAEALEAGRRDGRGGLSAQTVLHHHRVLRAALGQAVKWQLVVRNVAESVEPPRPERREIEALDEADTRRLLDALQGTPFWMPTALAASTGMRRGEVLALQWGDVDLSDGTVMVRRSLEETQAGLAVKAPKTARGRRRLTLPSLIIEILRQHRVEQKRQRLALGETYQNHDLVCARPDGLPWKPDEFTRQFARSVQRAGLPPVTFHQLRHSHASQLLKQGTSVTAVSARLGHASPAITMSVYAHCLAGEDAEAARRADAALRGVGSKVSN